jgi:hypothetical protein
MNDNRKSLSQGHVEGGLPDVVGRPGSTPLVEQAAIAPSDEQLRSTVFDPLPQGMFPT